MSANQQVRDGVWAQDRPAIPGYGVPEAADGMLDLDTVREKLAAAKNYWIASASEAGRPHSVPVWAAWIDDMLLFGGGPRTARNLKANPWTSVHLESATEVVIIEGPVAVIDDPDPALSQAIDDQYGGKYDWRPSGDGVEPVGKGWFRLDPERIIAWTQFPADATRWTRQRGRATTSDPAVP